MTVAANDIVRVTAQMTSSGEGDVQNVYWVKQFAAGVDDDDFMTAAAAALDTAYDEVDDLMPDNLGFRSIAGYNITQGVPLLTVTWPTLLTGGVDVASELPAPLSCLALMRTSKSRSVGRKYIAPFTEANQDLATWTSAVPIAVLALLDVLITGWSSGSGTAKIGVWSEKLLTWLPIIETTASNIVAYQRRRRQGTGS